MTNEHEDTGLADKFRPIRSVLLAVMIFLVTATVLIGGLAWLLSLSGIGLSVDTRFLMATMIFCAMVGATAAILLGAAMSFRIEQLNSDESQQEDTRLAVHEVEAEEVANLVLGKIFFSDVVDDCVGTRQAEELTARTRRRPVKSAASKKRR